MRATFRILPVILGAATLACGGGLQVNTGPGNLRANINSWTPPADYPAGPYGYSVGKTIDDLTFEGIQSATVNGAASTKSAAPIHLSDYRGKTKVLVILGTAGWCGPCNMEQPGMVQQFSAWSTANSADVGMLEVLVNNATPGTPAGMDFVDFWATEYSINFDLGTDPTGVLGPYYDINAFPMNMVVRTSDMTIQWQFNGENIAGLKSAVEFVIANP